MKIVAIVSANAEWRVVKELLPSAALQHSPYGEYFEQVIDTQPVTFFQGGWGKISAAASAQYVIAHLKPDVLLNLGTCGGFEGRVARRVIILVERTLVYDIIEQMGDGAEAIEHYATDIDLSWLTIPANVQVQRGLLVSADRDIVGSDIPMLIEKYNATAADWESGAIAWVAQRNRIRVLILRGVSDLVSVEGGEAYGDIALFRERTRAIMQALIDQLAVWLAQIK